MLWFRVFVLKFMGKCFESFMNSREYGVSFTEIWLYVFWGLLPGRIVLLLFDEFLLLRAVRMNRKIGIKREKL